MEDFGIEPMPTGRIFKLEVGNPKNGFKYTVGQTFKVEGEIVEIVEILRDDNAYHLHGKLRYLIYVVRPNDREILCWKWYEDVPVSVTCYLD
jgi:hypothetical protein